MTTLLLPIIKTKNRSYFGPYYVDEAGKKLCVNLFHLTFFSYSSAKLAKTTLDRKQVELEP